ncbi:MAG: hypothetical protein DRG30_08165 [Epsilonproteobacteria bacterium]|nr:MAG: hypothetical protein DRG30_08165 [Campylobacterota bacterium]
MNSVSTNFKFFIEYDNSPFILFNNTGKIIYLNTVAEVLFGYVGQQELYDIAISYAPKDFGDKTTRLELQYDIFSFYALTVAYENEEEIGLRLYSKPRLDPRRDIDTNKLPLTDLNIILEANITLFKLQNENKLTLLTDQDLPQCRIDQNSFSKLLRKTFESFRSSDSINISLKLVVGEYVIIQNKQEHIVQLFIAANGRHANSDEEIEAIASYINVSCTIKEFTVSLQIPFIQK